MSVNPNFVRERNLNVILFSFAGKEFKEFNLFSLIVYCIAFVSRKGCWFTLISISISLMNSVDTKASRFSIDQHVDNSSGYLFQTLTSLTEVFRSSGITSIIQGKKFGWGFNFLFFFFFFFFSFFYKYLGDRVFNLIMTGCISMPTLLFKNT